MKSRKRDEPVRLTRIYTRGGDAGETSLGDGSRVSKLDPLVRAYGAVDELNSILGWARLAADWVGLERIQNELFDLGADLSVPFAADDGSSASRRSRSTSSSATATRRTLHCRSSAASCCRAGPRQPHACTLRGRRAGGPSGRCSPADTRPSLNPLAAVYLNRLSDLLFILARAANAGGAEPLWTPGGER